MRMSVSLITPTPSERTPLASFLLWDMIVRCPKCGDKRKPVMDMIKGGLRPSTEVGSIFPKLTCRSCGSKPAALIGVCTFTAPEQQEDLTHLMGPKPMEQAA